MVKWHMEIADKISTWIFVGQTGIMVKPYISCILCSGITRIYAAIAKRKQPLFVLFIVIIIYSLYIHYHTHHYYH